MAAQLAESSGDLVRYNLWDSCGISCGIGFGPLVSALSIRLLGNRGLCTATAAAMGAIGTVWVALFLAAAFLVPGSEMPSRCAHTVARAGAVEADAAGGVGDGTGKAVNSDQHVAAKKMVYILAIQFGVARAFMNSALEVTTALFLETQFRMGHEALGVAISCSFLLGLPITALVLLIRQRYRPRDSSIFVILASIGLVSSLLFFTHLAQLLVGTGTSGNLRILLLADALVFSTGYAANGIADGFAYANVVPGTVYSPENLILVERLLQGSFSRLLGPVVGRFAAYYYGRDSYAMLQLCFAGLGLLTAWFLTACLDATKVP